MRVIGLLVRHKYIHLGGLSLGDSIDFSIRRWSLCWHRGENVDEEKGGEEKKQPEEDKITEEGKHTLSFKQINGMRIEEYASSPRLPRNGSSSFSAFNPLSEVPLEDEADPPSSELSSESGGDDGGEQLFKVRKWPTHWYWQFLVLLVRTFRQSRHVILSKLNLIQTFILTAVASVIWFQLPKHEDSISDRYGYVSACLIFLIC